MTGIESAHGLVNRHITGLQRRRKRIHDSLFPCRRNRTLLTLTPSKSSTCR